jgi:hypothetical protein
MSRKIAIVVFQVFGLIALLYAVHLMDVRGWLP